MKNMHILYGITILAVIGILTCFIGYATDTPQQSAYTTKSNQALKKKPCPCCDEKQKRMEKMMREWLNEKPQEAPLNKEVSATVSEPE